MARTLDRRVEILLRPEIEALGYELLLVEYLSAGRPTLRLYIDTPAGITVRDCEVVSRQVSGVLDVEDLLPGGYVLEVSSPGLDRPLVRLADFERFIGEQVRVVMAVPVVGQRRFSGEIKAVVGETVVLRIDGQDVTLEFTNMKSARLVPRFN